LRGWINRAIAILSLNLVCITFISSLDHLAQESKFQHRRRATASFVVCGLIALPPIRHNHCCTSGSSDLPACPPRFQLDVELLCPGVPIIHI
jgi:hypothetical protein